GHWWVPSGRTFYLPAAGTAAQEKAEALRHFFVPRRFEDPFGKGTSVDYDPHDLLVVRTVDAVTNTIAAVNDYRVVAPTLVIDPNGNRQLVSFDALGMVAGTAVKGKITENLGDDLAGFTPDLTQSRVDDFYA